ncbi:MAG: radical SAM protein [Desulfobacterales bacterium]|jgi:MoaA/NifB/PqqE/SkfB family radical SAM enzyme
MMKGAGSWLRRLAADRAPGQLVIQVTDHCNADCPQCGMNRRMGYPRSRLGVDDVRRVLDAAASRGVRAVSFTGGEPLLFLDDLVTLIDHAGSVGIPMIRTGTNGFLFRGWDRPEFEDRVHRLAERLSATPLRNFWISIDSSNPAVHEEIRGFPGVVKGIEKAVPIFHSHGFYPSANLGINRRVGGESPAMTAAASEKAFFSHFKNSFDRFFRLVDRLGFTIANACYPMSMNDGDINGLAPVYGASSTSSIVNFPPNEKALLFRALFESVQSNRSRLRIFSPLCALRAIGRQVSSGSARGYPCRGGRDFFFVDASHGDTFPCGFRGSENLGKFWRLNGVAGNGDSSGGCLACEWECFRDPSEMIGPILDGLHRPGTLAGRIRSDPAFFGLWVEDLRYYQACDYFNGKVPPRRERLNRFKGASGP